MGDDPVFCENPCVLVFWYTPHIAWATIGVAVAVVFDATLCWTHDGVCWVRFVGWCVLGGDCFRGVLGMANPSVCVEHMYTHHLKTIHTKYAHTRTHANTRKHPPTPPDPGVHGCHR